MWGLLIPPFWTSGDVCPEFQNQGGSLACLLYHLHAMDSTDSPLVQHLLTSWLPISQQNLFDLCSCTHIQVFVGIEPGNKCETQYLSHVGSAKALNDEPDESIVHKRETMREIR